MFKVNWSNKNQHMFFSDWLVVPFFFGFCFLRGLAFRAEGAGGGIQVWMDAVR